MRYFIYGAKLWPETPLFVYGGHLENVSYKQLVFIIIWFIDPESMEVDTKIVFLIGLEAKLLRKT